MADDVEPDGEPDIDLPARWYPLRHHAAQHGLWTSPARFDVVEAGRRSGKTEIVKRLAVIEALRESHLNPGVPWFTKLCAPTRDQAKFIFWSDIKDLSQPWWVKDPNETDLQVFLRGGAQIWICGLDRPQRIEGQPIDRLGVDELADVRDGAWDRNLRPALDTETPGKENRARAWLFGVPRPGTQFARLAQLALDPNEPDYAYHHWTAASVLSPKAIEDAKRTLDPNTYAQEYEARRVNFQGMVYYQWSQQDHYRAVTYDPSRPLLICLDFNVEPGVAAILQEQDIDGVATTCVVGEVHIPRNSNTVAVCRRLEFDWSRHAGKVQVFGDPSGGARHTSQTEGSDWVIVRDVLRPVFGDRLDIRVDKKAPPVRDRINAVNSRLKSTAGVVRFAANPKLAPNVVRDFEGVMLLAGGSGEPDKKAAEAAGMSHLTDAIGYYIHQKFPLDDRVVVIR